MTQGNVALVLHAHRPYVRHPESDDPAEERWFFEATTETYIPLLEVLAALERDRIPARFTLSLSPPLLGMLADRLLRERYLRYLDRLVELAEKEERRTRGRAALHELASMYLARFWRARTLFLDDWQQDLIAAFRAYQEQGAIDLITSAATHGLLPLLSASPAVVRVQIDAAAAEYRRFFGRSAEGLWLPECAYQPGLDEDVARAGFRYVILDTHGITQATPRPVYGVYAPIACESGLAVFGRDPDSARQLTMDAEGYPTDGWYRDGERDIVLELDDASARDYLGPDGRRLPTGIKYRRRGGGGERVYDAREAERQVAVHARHFVASRLRQSEWLARNMDRPPVIVCAYEAERFGQQWFEGPQWLELVLRGLAATPGLTAVTPVDDLERHPTVQLAVPAASTCGGAGYYDQWIDPANDWIYRHLHATAERLYALCRRYPSADELIRRALTQAVRELLLAQASDWPSMMARPDAADYATRRVHDHLVRCQRLCEQVDRAAVEERNLAGLEDTDNIFPALDYRLLT